MKQLQIQKYFFKSIYLHMHVCGDLELYQPLIIWVLTFSTILVDLEHHPKLEWHLVSILVFLQTVMVNIILQKIYMQHFSIKWF